MSFLRLLMISYDDFKKLDLRVGTILEAERVDGSEKLLKLQVDLGDQKRQVIVGIAKSYEPENLINKQIVILVNLEPRSLMGLESQGMLLAADKDGLPIILVPEKEVVAGSVIK